MTTQQSTVLKKPAIWHNRNFMLLWGGSLISNFGYQMYIIGVPLLIYDLSRSALAMSMMRAIEFLPNIFIGILAGVFVDRLNRKRMMQWTSGIRVAAMAGIILLLLSGELSLWGLYLLGFILSVSSYTFGNAHHAVLPQIVSKEDLTSANAKLSFINTLIQTVGPGLAGTFLIIYSYTTTLSIYMVSLLALLVSVSLLKLPPIERNTQENNSFKEDIKEGIEALFRNKILLTPTITVLFMNFASSLVIGVLVFYVKDQLGATAAEVGLMFSISAIGGFIGAIVVSRIRKKFGRGNIYTYCILLDAIGMALLIFASTSWAIGIALAIRTFSTTISNIVYFTIRQEFTPNHLLGRVAGTSSMLMKLTLPLGLFLAGLWAEWFPIRILFIISTLIFVILFMRLLPHSFRKLQ